MSPELVLLLLNLLLIDLVLFGGFSLLALSPFESAEAKGGEDSAAAAPAAGKPTESNSKAAPPVSEDPIIQFLNENPEEGGAKPSGDPQPAATPAPVPPPPKPAPRTAPTQAAPVQPVPPTKPGGDLPPAPREPGVNGPAKAKNAPKDVKAPSRPKKRI